MKNFLGTLLGFLKPLINNELNSLCAALTASKAELEQAAAGGAQSLEAVVNAKLASLVGQSPLLAVVAQTFLPSLEAFIAGAVASGETQVGPLIDKIVAFVTKEEQYI